jgi:Ca2+-binding EF-hand superfamily protein
LKESELVDVATALAQACDDRGLVPSAAFCTSMEAFGGTPRVWSDLFEATLGAAAEHGDYLELVTALSPLCGGHRDARAKLTFALWDEDGDGFLSQPEMITYLESKFRLRMRADPRLRAAADVTARELAEATAASAFAECDWNQDGQLSWDEFHAWYSGADGGAADVSPEATAEEADMPLADAIQVVGLADVPLEAMRSALTRAADGDGNVSREAFHHALEQVMPPATSAAAAKVTRAVDTIFNVFDADGSGSVDQVEMGPGLAIVCAGSMEQRARAAFATVDADNSGFVSAREMADYFTSMFKVVLRLNPGLETGLSGSVEDLAAATARECFAAADINLDNQLSFDEFHTWYQSNEAAMKPSVMQHADAGSAISDLQAASGLAAVRPAAVVEALREKMPAGAQGLDRESFADVFMALLGAEGGAEAAPFLDRLFDVFDENGDGCVDLLEVASGVSLLCGGSDDEKIDTLFALFDTNDDGVMSRSELQTYLVAAFRVMLEAEELEEDGAAFSAGDMAAEAVADCFGEGQESLTKEQFRSWFLQTQSSS